MVSNCKRTIHPFSYHHHAAWSCLQNAKANNEDRNYQLMASLTFSAFSFESFINYIGKDRLKFWDEIERIRFFDKVAILYDDLNIDFDKSRRPMQTINELFDFRNKMAHGRSEVLIPKEKITWEDLDNESDKLKADWEKFITLKNAERALQDIETQFEEIALAAGLEPHPHWFPSMITGSMPPKDL